MAKIAAGLLMYRFVDQQLEVFLAHPGGPLYVNKDEDHWTIPKGELSGNEELLDAAQREFTEETGFVANGPFIELTPITQKGGKVVHAWAFAGDFDPAKLVSNKFSMEWPPRSGRKQEFPEVDRGEYFEPETAKRKVKSAQAPLIAELVRLLNKSDAIGR